MIILNSFYIDFSSSLVLYIDKELFLEGIPNTQNSIESILLTFLRAMKMSKIVVIRPMDSHCPFQSQDRFSEKCECALSRPRIFRKVLRVHDFLICPILTIVFLFIFFLPIKF